MGEVAHSDSERLAKQRGIVDPAFGVGESLASALAGAYALDRVTVSQVVRRPQMGVDLILDVNTTWWGLRSGPSNPIGRYAVHPGRVRTAIWRHAPAPVRWWARHRGSISEEEGARTILYCATAPDLATASGRYYEREREVEPSAAGRDDALAARLWEESERLTAKARTG